MRSATKNVCQSDRNDKLLSINYYISSDRNDKLLSINYYISSDRNDKLFNVLSKYKLATT